MFKILGILLTISLFNNVFCDEEFVYYPDVRISYKLHSVPQTWLDAKTICNEVGSKLAMPMNENEAFTILMIFQEYLDKENSKEIFMFLDSHDMFASNEFITRDYHIEYFYHTWATGQPSSFTNRNCLVMDTNGTLHDQYCNNTYIYMCQVEDSSYEESLDKLESRELFPTDPTYLFDSASRKYFKLHMHKRTWPIARSICRAEGGNLAIIRSSSEQSFLTNMLGSGNNLWPLPGLYKDDFFVGHHDLFRQRTFYTVKDQILNNGFANWTEGEPSYELGNERCGSIIRGEGTLNNIPCTVVGQFFCERTFN